MAYRIGCIFVKFFRKYTVGKEITDNLRQDIKSFRDQQDARLSRIEQSLQKLGERIVRLEQTRQRR